MSKLTVTVNFGQDFAVLPQLYLHMSVVSDEFGFQKLKLLSSSDDPTEAQNKSLVYNRVSGSSMTLLFYYLAPCKMTPS